MFRMIACATLAGLFILSAKTFAQGPVVLYDPGAQVPETKVTEAEEDFVRGKLLSGAKARWNGDESCSVDLNIIGIVDGSFTKAQAKQRAIVYELCQTGNGFANNAIAVVQDDRVVAHFTVEGGWNLETRKVPDINQNGRDEILIETGGGMHQGYTGSSVTILEVSETAVTELGIFLAYTNECEAPAADKYCDRSYKITARPGATPTFYSQKFLNRGSETKPRWTASGKAAAAKPIGDLNMTYEAVK